MDSGLELARRYFEGGNFARCLDALAGAGDSALADPLFWFLRAESLRRLRRYGEAVAAARAGLERTPQDFGLLDSLGLSLVATGRVAEGDLAYLSALELAPDNPILLGHHAGALADLCRTTEAKSVVAKLMTIAPDAVFSLESRASVAVKTSDPQATQFVSELLAADPENELGHILRGNLAVRRKQPASAAQAFETAAALNPRNDSVVRAARQSRLAAHPLLAPSRKILKLGRSGSRMLYVVIIVFLVAIKQPTLALVFAGAWLMFLVVIPRGLRLYHRRRYGDL